MAVGYGKVHFMIMICIASSYSVTRAYNCHSSSVKAVKHRKVKQDSAILIPGVSRSLCALLCISSECCLAANYNRVVSSCEVLMYNVTDMVDDTDTDVLLLSDAFLSNCVDQKEPRGYWGFRFFQHKDLRDHDNDKLENTTLRKCKEACLNATKFICRSLDFRRDNCFLSAHTAKSAGVSLRHDKMAVHLERNCFVTSQLFLLP